MKIERLVDTLRLPQSGPGIHAQVFLCFRVLLLRMSGHHITSMWPIIVSEMVQVMIHIEHNLRADTEEFRYIKTVINNKYHLFDHINFVLLFWICNKCIVFWGIWLVFHFWLMAGEIPGMFFICLLPVCCVLINTK